jgi:putative methyltransferase (TIGR04325 family)
LKLADLARRVRRSTGYEDGRLVEVVHEKTLRLREAITVGAQGITEAETPLLEAIALSSVSRLRIVDFGGACGAQYLRVRHAAGDRIHSWTVVETPAIVLASRDLEDDVLTFATELPGSADLVNSSGALQYLPDPIAGLYSLLDLGASVVCLTRLHFGQGGRELQRSRLADNGPGPLPAGMADGWVAYPRTSLVRDQVEAALVTRYRIVTVREDGFTAVEQ